MDLFTGKKIAELRKFNSLSQEALAEKCGVSRQAVSKWERGEASPDMDNIVALAHIFRVSVDDLLGDKKASEITDFSALEQAAAKASATPAEAVPEPALHSAAQTDAREAAVVADAPAITDASTSENASAANAEPEPPADPAQPVRQSAAVLTEPAKKTAGSGENPADGGEKKSGESENGKPVKAKRKVPQKTKKEKTRYKPQITKKMNRVPVFIIVPLVYIILGITQKMWHPLWLIVLFIPIYYFTSFAFGAKNRRSFFLRLPVPLVLIVVFLFLGFTKAAWHPAWMVFLILPVYYWAAAIQKKN